MAARSASLLRALLVATLVSFLLMQGVAGVFEACFCSCYNDCKRNNPHLPNAKEKCHWWCFKDSRCSFSCKNRGHRGQSSSDDAVGVAIASGGGRLGGMVNGTGAGGAVAAGGGSSLGMVNGTGEGAAP
ncbi:hypothetical protein GQ55_5G179400 [Panicum hallii var. hallii]|uniref:Uncharacterized protein n=1 Tax=Panicum hallii var. hallii TaxID=1504633 RepID=A0A2T7DHI4_9POAL|nr:hypothetical protein GQ55_5G179400 [Panicum hallii var. hallii]